MHAHHNIKKKEMGFLFNNITLLISILLSSFLFNNITPSASLLLENQGGINDVHQKFPLPMVHRKLRFSEKEVQVTEFDEARDLASQKQKDSLPRKQEQTKQNMVLGSKGTRQERMERDEDPSQYFTMDYTRVRRRRPIHNKQLPVGP